MMCSLREHDVFCYAKNDVFRSAERFGKRLRVFIIYNAGRRPRHVPHKRYTSCGEAAHHLPQANIMLRSNTSLCSLSQSDKLQFNDAEASHVPARGHAGGEGDGQVEAAGVGVGVEDLSGEV